MKRGWVPTGNAVLRSSYSTICGTASSKRQTHFGLGRQYQSHESIMSNARSGSGTMSQTSRRQLSMKQKQGQNREMKPTQSGSARLLDLRGAGAAPEHGSR